MLPYFELFEILKRNRMNVKVKDLMVKSVITTMPHKTIGHARNIMANNNIKSIPIVDNEMNVKGIITSTDILNGTSETTPVSSVMITKVYTVPAYSDVHIAARVMRNHKINHLVVTDEQKIVGVLSAYDLLRLVEDHRFVMKNPPTPSKKRRQRE